METWTKMSTNTRLRDRSVKIIQYGCQMLMGYYSSRLNSKQIIALSTARRTASTSRKAFWLLKSFNHCAEIHSAISNSDKLINGPLFCQLDFAEQIFLAIYYCFENLIFFARVKMLDVDEDYLDVGCNWSWFLGDLACFASSVLQYRQQLKHCSLNDHIASNNGSQVSKININIAKLNKMKLSLAIAVLELGVSLHYVNGYKWILGRPISEGHVGLMGVLSSALIIYEGYDRASASSTAPVS